MQTQRLYEWWYPLAFLIVELVQATIGIVTLTVYRPELTYKLAKWYANRRLRVTTWQN